MDTFNIRDAETSEALVMGSFSMLTILETLPEARSNPDIMPNFSAEEMAANYARKIGQDDRRFLVVEHPEYGLIGHTIFVCKTDDHGVSYGYCYTRYVLPKFRRLGLGSRLLDRALTWFESKHVAYALAHTHATNHALRGLFESRGFVVVEETQERWAGVVLRKELAGTRS